MRFREKRESMGRGRGFPAAAAAAFLLIFFAAGAAYPQGLVVMAKKVSGELPLDRDSSLWSGPYDLEIPLVPQVMAQTRIYESQIKKLRVRAAHNTKEIAFLLEWEDRTKDAAVSGDSFSDAAAVEFPSAAVQGKPHFAMGDRENTVNIWYWKAAWQERQEREKLYATVDDFLGGVMAGNPVSQEKASPVQNLVAQGYGTATDIGRTDGGDLDGKGLWKSDRWSVVFRRSLASGEKFDAVFREGGVTPVSFAIWNGSDNERGSRKVVSTWYYVGLETEERKSLYVYPAIAFVASAAVLAGIIIAVRKKRKV